MFQVEGMGVGACPHCEDDSSNEVIFLLERIHCDQ